MADTDLAHAEICRYLRKEEGERLRPYLCQAGVATIGVGATTYLDGRKVTLRDPPITREQMDRMLDREAWRYMDEVMNSIDRVATTNELVGLVMLVYNIGHPAFSISTVRRRHIAGDREGAARAFGLFNKVRNTKTKKLEVNKGLVGRRTREAAIYISNDLDPDDIQTGSPQAVAPESSMLASPINQAGAVTGVTGALGLMSQVSDQATQASGLVSTIHGLATQVSNFIGMTPTQLVWLALAVAGGTIIYQRYRQRSGGWA